MQSTSLQLSNSSDIDDMGYGDQPFGQPDRIGGIWILRRYGWVTVNGDPETRQLLSMKDTHKGIIMASPLALNLTRGKNTITVGGAWNGNGTKAADIDKIIVYPLENRHANQTNGSHVGAPTPTPSGALSSGSSQLRSKTHLVVVILSLAVMLYAL